MKYQGQVIKRRFAAGSKSEHDAVMLSTDSGDYVLRRHGGNAFRDPVLDSLVGETITCDGVVDGYTLKMKDWTKIPPERSTEET